MKWKTVMAGFALACVPSLASAQTVTRDQAVTYGGDDRHDVWEAGAESSEEWAEVARQSAVSLFTSTSVQINGDTVSLAGDSLGDRLNLCDTERYIEQPAGAFCSGSLVGPDLVMTAGHCVGSQDSCGIIRVVFDYLYEADGELAEISIDDVYACNRVIVREEGSFGGLDLDYAIIQLDRPVVGRTPATLNTQAQAVPGQTQLVMIGSPSGIPLKIEDGGAVRSSRGDDLDFFVATTDSFGGNSGSGVWNEETGELVGILVSGETDYENDGGCQVVNDCGPTSCSGENVTYAFRAFNDFCDAGTDENICGTSSECGDGFCAYDEDASSCSEDCEPVTCGDGVCAIEEYESCSQDCIIEVPDEWTCDPGFYSAFDGCDCECGTYDPDCDYPDQDVFGCGLFGTCSEEGICQGGGPAAFCDLTTPFTAPASRQNTPWQLWPVLGALAIIGISRRRRDE